MGAAGEVGKVAELRLRKAPSESPCHL